MITCCKNVNILDVTVIPCFSLFTPAMGYISLCHVDNHIRRFKRPEWIAHRDFTPLETLPDDCLAEAATADA